MTGGLYNFTIMQLQELVMKLRLPSPTLMTLIRVVVPTVEALAVVCRSHSEPSRLPAVANEFGRSGAAYNRVARHVIYLLHQEHHSTLFFNTQLIESMAET